MGLSLLEPRGLFLHCLHILSSDATSLLILQLNINFDTSFKLIFFLSTVLSEALTSNHSSMPKNQHKTVARSHSPKRVVKRRHRAFPTAMRRFLCTSDFFEMLCLGIPSGGLRRRQLYATLDTVLTAFEVRAERGGQEHDLGKPRG